MFNALGNVVLVIVGGAIVAATVLSAARTVVLPHDRPARLTQIVFSVTRSVGQFLSMVSRDLTTRHRINSLHAPVALLGLPMAWLGLAMAGFTLVFAGLGVDSWIGAFRMAGSSLLTLGIADLEGWGQLIAGFLAAALAISVLGILLVTYLPTMYSVYSAREALISDFETFAGEPPRVVDLLIRHFRLEALDRLSEQWRSWRGWFVEARETHTALPAVVLFTSSSPGRGWVSAAGVALDGAALCEAALDTPVDIQARLCMRSGYIALGEIAAYFGDDTSHVPTPDDPISVTREEFDDVMAELEAAELPLVVDRELAWRDFRGWRVNYDRSLRTLARVTSTDDVSLRRSVRVRVPE